MPKKEINMEVSKGEETVRGSEIERKIIENLVSLQKIHTNLIERFDKLSDQISALLNLFEVAAKSFTKQPAFEVNKDREFSEKIDMLLEQNKTLARGISMMEERIRNYEQSKPEENPEATTLSQSQNPPAPKIQNIEDQPAQTSNRPLPRF